MLLPCYAHSSPGHWALWFRLLPSVWFWLPLRLQALQSQFCHRSPSIIPGICALLWHWDQRGWQDA